MEKNNEIKLVGRIITPIVFDHEIFGERFFTFKLKILRNSDNTDTIPIIISERIQLINELRQGNVVQIDGEIRSHNEYKPEGGVYLKIYGFVKDIQKIEYDYSFNEVTLRGFICKQPVYRNTPLGRQITDIFLAVNREFNKSCYLPCIAWGRNATYAKNFSVGTEIIIKGRFQSRDYLKKENGKEVTKTALEVSIQTIEKI